MSNLTHLKFLNKSMYLHVISKPYITAVINFLSFFFKQIIFHQWKHDAKIRVYEVKVENTLKVALILSHHLHIQWKFKLWSGKFAWVVKAKHCWALSTNFWKQKVCWHYPAMFCLITSSKISRPWFEFSLKVMGLNAGYFLKFFLL